jgi:hypothetical protein
VSDRLQFDDAFQSTKRFLDQILVKVTAHQLVFRQRLCRKDAGVAIKLLDLIQGVPQHLTVFVEVPREPGFDRFSHAQQLLRLKYLRLFASLPEPLHR